MDQSSTTQLDKYINDLANLYTTSFNVYRDEKIGDIPLAFYAEYLRRDEKFLMTKTIKVWSVENQQYVFLKKQEEPLTKKDIHQLGSTLQSYVNQFVPSDKEHMSTVFLGVIVTNQPISEDVVKEIRKFRILKFLKLGLHGWAEFYIGAVTMMNETTYIHKKGKEFMEPFNYILIKD